MTTPSEVHLLQNPMIGAVVQWSAIDAAYRESGSEHGLSLPALMLVVPMVFHRRTVEAIKGKRRISGLAKAIEDQPQIPLGLQRRLERFAGLSLQSIDFGLSAGLFLQVPGEPWPTYIPTRRSVPPDYLHPSDDVADMLKAAQRVGWWITTSSLSSAALLLKVQF